jgi:hypothetical protein
MWYQPGVKWWVFCVTTKTAISLRSVILFIIMTTLRASPFIAGDYRSLRLILKGLLLMCHTILCPTLDAG